MDSVKFFDITFFRIPVIVDDGALFWDGWFLLAVAVVAFMAFCWFGGSQRDDYPETVLLAFVIAFIATVIAFFALFIGPGLWLSIFALVLLSYIPYRLGGRQ